MRLTTVEAGALFPSRLETLVNSDSRMDTVRIIAFDDLAAYRMADVPYEGWEISNVPRPPSCTSINLQARNHRRDHPQPGDIYVFADVSFKAPLIERQRFSRWIDLAFPPQLSIQSCKHDEPAPRVAFRTFTHEYEDTYFVDVDVKLDLSDKPEIPIIDALAPLLAALRIMANTAPRAFICHASEDKPAARLIATALRTKGDSLVQKINIGLENTSHLILLLSNHSVAKPWVQREFSAALIGQLSHRQITVLPVRLDDAEPPTIIADIKYADGRQGIPHAIGELVQALFSTSALNP
jgi:hypothetical protein